MWGSQPQLNATGGLTSLHEAWALVNLSKHFSFKFGRQEINYDDQRIFGNVGWAQQARSHDAGIFIYKTGTFQAHVGGAYNQDGASLSGTIASNGGYKAFQYLWIHKDWEKTIVSGLFLNNGKQIIKTLPDGTEQAWDNYSQTVGGRIAHKNEKLSGFINGYYQFGVDGDVLNTAISAYNIAGEVKYQLKPRWNAGAGMEMLSGNSETEINNKNNAFNPMYTTHHKFNGTMDYFYGGTHYGSVGLNDFYVSLKYKMEKVTATIATHLFSANASVLDDGAFNSQGLIEEMNPNLGTEIDFVMAFNLTKGAPVKIGYGHLFPTATMEALKGGDYTITQNWAWVMITLKPTFIKTEKK